MYRGDFKKAVGRTTGLVPLIGAAWLALALTPAFGQSATTGMRGAVSEEEIRQMLNQQGQSGQSTQNRAEPATTGSVATPQSAPFIPAQAYEPISEAEPAMDAEQDTGGAAPLPARRPTTALERDRQNQERITSGPETAAQRRQQAEAEMNTPPEGVDRVTAIESDVDNRTNIAAERAEAIEDLDRSPEENPYDAVGIAMGSFVLRPTVETGVTVTSNADSSFDGESATISESTLRLTAISEFGGDRTQFGGYANYRKTLSGQEIDEPEGGVNFEFERALGNEYSANGALSYTISPESFSSPVEIPGTASQPTQHTLNASLGGGKDIGKLRLRATGDVDREWYGDADLAGGGTVSQQDRDNTLATLTLRGGYEISPALTPFIEVQGGRRIYDNEKDAAGYERSANHYSASVGTEFDFSEKLNGEVSAGYMVEDLDDARLDDLAGLNLAASVNWSPERGTTVRLTGSTTAEGTTTIGSSGSLLYSLRGNVERQIRANVTANAGAGIAYRDYQSTGDSDTIFSAELGGTWWLNRYVGLTTRVQHEQVKSTLPFRDTETNSIFLGLRLQR